VDTLTLVDVTAWTEADWRQWGEDVKRRRVFAGWSRDDLEQRSGVSAETVRTIEDGDRGRWRPRRLATYREIERVLGHAEPVGGDDRLATVLDELVTLRKLVEEWNEDRVRVGAGLIDTLAEMTRAMDRLQRQVARRQP
jgi:transcriptional regulator with XRE-family HTH domain